MDVLSGLLRELRGRTSFEPAAEDACRWMQQRFERGLAEAAEAGMPELKRAEVRAVSLFLAGPLGMVAQRVDGSDTQVPRLSQTLWRQLQGSRAGVSLRFHAGEVSITPLLESGDLLDVEGTSIEPSMSFRSLAGKDSHAVAWPLVDGEGRADGFLLVELRLPMFGPFFLSLPSPVAKELVRFATVVPVLLRRLPVSQAALADLPTWAGAHMRQVLGRLATLARLDGNLLISGPPGTGKTRLARWVHDRSAVRKGPLVEVDPLAVPPSEFGRLLSGADGKGGKAAEAAGGTLVLDDAHLWTADAQLAVLAMLDSFAERRLLGDPSVPRVVVCASASLEVEVLQGRFSRDLLQQIRFFEIEVPAMTRRLDEIPNWATTFAREMHQRMDVGGQVVVDPTAMDELVRRTWSQGLRGLRRDLATAYSIALSERDPSASDSVVVSRIHLPPAEDGQEPATEASLTPVLQAAADLLANLAAARWAAGQPIDLDDCDILRGLVVEVAVQRWGQPEAIRRLGRGHMIASGNGAKLIAREIARLATLRSKLGLS